MRNRFDSFAGILMRKNVFAGSLLYFCAGVVRAAVPSPVDAQYPGAIAISVDATDLSRRIFRVHETIPVQVGNLTLLYPQWLPGNHSPTGSIDKLAGLVVKANGKVIAWKRDPLNVFAFHVDVPQGASEV
jgi:hypothetical protein